MSRIVPQDGVDGIINIIANKDLAKALTAYIDLRKQDAEFKHKLSAITAAYSAMGRDHDRMADQRDKDREAMLSFVNFLITEGQHQMASDIFKDFIAKAPRYSDDVVTTVLGRRD
jgi:hypothetical protein